MTWLRARFYTTGVDDYRPIYEPPALPVGPWWCTGYSADEKRAVIVAFVNSEADVLRQWPEAEDIDAVAVEGVTFTDRFPRPDWWPEASTLPPAPTAPEPEASP